MMFFVGKHNAQLNYKDSTITKITFVKFYDLLLNFEI